MAKDSNVPFTPPRVTLTAESAALVSPGQPDRLPTIVTWIAAAGIFGIAFLVFDAAGGFRAARPTRLAIPAECPAPAAGEKLHITVELHDGKLDFACNTVRPFAPMRRSAS